MFYRVGFAETYIGLIHTADLVGRSLPEYHSYPWAIDGDKGSLFALAYIARIVIPINTLAIIT